MLRQQAYLESRGGGCQAVEVDFPRRRDADNHNALPATGHAKAPNGWCSALYAKVHARRASLNQR